MPLFSQKCSRENGFHPCSLRRLAAVSLLAGFIFLAGAELSRAATIVLNATDNPNTTSFNSNLHWTGGAAPAAGTNYQTATFRLRTPANTAAIAFAGDSLEIQTGGGELRIKTGATVTVTNLILAGGAILDLTAPNGGNAATLAGGLTLNGTATLQSGIQAGEAANTLTITSLISGVGGFTTVGSFGTIILSASNNFTGGATVNGGTVLVNGVIANSPVTVSAGTLGGNGIIKGAVTNSAGGNLSAGLGGADTSTLTVSNNLFLAGTTLFALNRGGAPTASKISGVNLATLGGTLTVTNAGATLQLGDTFTLFSAASFSGNFSTINLPALTNGLG